MTTINKWRATPVVTTFVHLLQGLQSFASGLDQMVIRLLSVVVVVVFEVVVIVIVFVVEG